MDDFALGILNKVKFLFYIRQFKYFKSKRANNRIYNVDGNIYNHIFVFTSNF